MNVQKAPTDVNRAVLIHQVATNVNVHQDSSYKKIEGPVKGTVSHFIYSIRFNPKSEQSV